MWKSWNYFQNFYRHQLSFESSGEGERSRAGGTAGQLPAGLTLDFQAALIQDTSRLQAWVPSLPQSVKALVNLFLAG